MKKIVILFLGLLLVNGVFTLSLGSGDFSDNGKTINLSVGKNNLSQVDYNPFYVKEFVERNPEIRSVSYTVGGITYGYVNAFGGIGVNFVVRPELEYEIVSQENVTVVLQ